MDHRFRLGNSSTASGFSDPGGPVLLFYLVPTLLHSIFTLFCLPSSTVSLSSLILGVPMHEYLGKHSCMSSTFPLANTECFLFFFPDSALQVHKEDPVRDGKNTDALVNLYH